MDNLTDMSNRWAGHEKAAQTDKSPNFFDQLFNSLELQHQRFQGAVAGQNISISVSALEAEGGPVFDPRLNNSNAARDSHVPTKTNEPPISSLLSGMSYSNQLSNSQWHVDAQSPTTISRDDLFTISQTLMNNDFLELDRIVSFEDMMAIGNITQYYSTNS
jgi:hypothetical protein